MIARPASGRLNGPVLFLENDDSFSWNVVDRLPFGRDEVWIRRGRDVASDPSALSGVAAVVVGPGPTDPVRAGIVRVVHAAAAARLPLLGICLGHQAIGLAFGASLVRTTPVHGKQHLVRFERSRLLPGIEGERLVMRYHSLSLAAVRSPLTVVAETRDGVPMAIEHRALPLVGMQFHPDSFGTPDGEAMIAAFFRAAL